MVYPVMGYILCLSMGKSIHSTEYKKIIAAVRKAREEAGLTQVEVADLIGKPQSYISKIERGERRLDVAEVRQLAKIYKKNINSLLDYGKK